MYFSLADLIFYTTVFVFIVFALVLSVISDKIMTKSIKAKYPQDEIIYDFKTSPVFTIAFPFGSGSCVGGMLAPILLDNTFSQLSPFGKFGFIFFCICMLIFIPANIALIMFKVVLTDKRIVSMSFFKIKWWKANFEFFISDIESISWNNAYDIMNIKLKNGKIHYLGGNKKHKQCYEKIRKMLE